LLADLRVIFTIPTTNRRFVADALDEFLDLFVKFQGMHPQRRQIGLHIEFESNEWMVAFNLTLGLCGMLEAICSWVNSPDAHTSKLDETNELVILPSAGSFIGTVLQSLLAWVEQQPRHRSKLASVTVQDKTFSPWLGSFQDDDDSSGSGDDRPPRSFHLLLHRFWACSVNEALKNPLLSDFLSEMSVVLDADSTGPRLNVEDEVEDSIKVHPLLVDFPLDCLVLSSEIRVGLFSRNGMIMRDQ
jgi:hypothetical protein